MDPRDKVFSVMMHLVESERGSWGYRNSKKRDMYIYICTWMLMEYLYTYIISQHIYIKQINIICNSVYIYVCSKYTPCIYIYMFESCWDYYCNSSTLHRYIQTVPQTQFWRKKYPMIPRNPPKKSNPTIEIKCLPISPKNGWFLGNTNINIYIHIPSMFPHSYSASPLHIPFKINSISLKN